MLIVYKFHYQGKKHRYFGVLEVLDSVQSISFINDLVNSQVQNK